MADKPTLVQRLRAIAGEPWPFPVPDPDFGMTGNVMREAAARLERIEPIAGIVEKWHRGELSADQLIGALDEHMTSMDASNGATPVEGGAVQLPSQAALDSPNDQKVE